MLLSIIMPAYNAEKTIRETIESVLCLLNDNVELIIVDDGSTDKTSEICNYFLKSNSSIKYFKINNNGVSYARNYGLNVCLGEYVIFIDSDDKNMLNSADLKILRERPEFVLLSYIEKKYDGNLKNVINKCDFIKKEYLQEYIVKNFDLFSSPWAKIYKKDLVIKNKLQFILNQKYGEDTSFIFSYLSTINKGIIVSNITSYLYNLNVNSASGFKKYYENMYLYLYNILLSFLKISDTDRNNISKMANYLFDKAIMHYYQNNKFDCFCKNFTTTYNIFKKYLDEKSINTLKLYYYFPITKKNIRKFYFKNMYFKFKHFLKKILY